MESRHPSSRRFNTALTCIVFFWAMHVMPFGAMASDGPERVARAFYGLYLDIRPSGIPDAAIQARFRPLMTSELSRLLKKARAVEDAHRAATQNQEPPFVQGDLFTSLFEGATSYALGACAVEGKRAYCDIDLTYSEGPETRPTTWTDKLALVQRAGSWQVDDIAFGGAWDFGQHGMLRMTLRDVVAQAK